MNEFKDFQMPLADAMTTQRAIRRIKPDPVDDALVLKLIELALTNQVGNGRGVDQHLKGRDSAGFLFGRQQLLRYDATQRGRNHSPDVSLLVRWKRVDDAVDCLCRTIGVQRAHDQNSHFGGRHRYANCLKVTHFAHENDVGVLAQRRMKCIRE